MSKLSINFLIGVLITFSFTACHKNNFHGTQHHFKLPIFKEKEQNKILKFQLEETIPEKLVKKITLDLTGTTKISDLKEISILYSESEFKNAIVLKRIIPKKAKIELNIDKKISSKYHFWVTATLHKNTDISHKVTVNVSDITTNDGKKIRFKNTSNTSQYIATTVKQKNENGVHTFRIPGLATTNKGTLISVYDIRYNSSVDLQANVDVGMSRSTDGGQTWEPTKAIIDMGTYGGKPEDENGVGDPAVLVDRTNNTIWVAALWKHGGKDKRAWWDSKEGMTPEETGQLVLVKSTDDGKTWSAPINITSQVKQQDWKLFFNGPGKGITTTNGTLIFAAQFKDANAVPYATLIYSKDQGKTWNVGSGIKPETTEAQIVELTDGSIMINARDDRNRANRKDSINGRTVATTKNLGKTWEKHPSSRKALIEPNCMASLISYNSKKYGKLLFFSNPNSKTHRNHLTIKASLDEGATWGNQHQIEIYENDSFGYSCMTIIDNTYIGILYEGVRDLYFQKIPIEDIISKK